MQDVWEMSVSGQKFLVDQMRGRTNMRFELKSVKCFHTVEAGDWRAALVVMGIQFLLGHDVAATLGRVRMLSVQYGASQTTVCLPHMKTRPW